MGLIKLGVVVFASYTLGGKAGEFVLAKVSPGTVSKDSLSGARWAGRAVAFVGLGLLASKL